MTYEHMPCSEKTQVENAGNHGKLSERQAECLRVFEGLVNANRGLSPSLAELAEAMGVKVPTVQWLVRRLIEKGVLERPAGKYRALQFVKKDSGEVAA